MRKEGVNVDNEGGNEDNEPKRHETCRLGQL